MRENIASVLEININQISIKAKTNEHMDSAGEMKSIQAQAVVLVEKI